MKTEKTTSAVAIIALFDIIRDNGMGVDALEKKTGISRKKMNDPDARITMTQFLSLWDIAVTLTGDPALGLHLRKQYGRNLMHFVVILAMNSPTLYEGLHHWINYSRLICETDKIDLTESDGDYVITYTNLSPAHENRWIPEHHMSLAYDYATQMASKHSQPLEVGFRHPDPGYADEYRRVFNCPVYFDQPTTFMRVKKEDLHTPAISPDPYLQAVLIKHAQASMKALPKQNTLHAHVRQQIIEMLPFGQATIANVSHALNMDRTTLHRQLKKQGLSFTDLLTDIRKAFATNYLQQEMTVAQVTCLLGFSEPSAFQRAFKRWFGVNPGDYKKKNSISDREEV